MRPKKVFIGMMIGISVVATLIAFRSKERGVDCSYISEGNDLAEIHLILYKNNKFILSFRDLESNHKSLWKGRWYRAENRYKLTFSLFRKPDLHILFSQKGENSDLVVQNKHKIAFNVSENGIWIWSIYCIKVKR